LDYALNYVDENKNDIAKFESIIKIDQLICEMEMGRIIPNFLVEEQDEKNNKASKKSLISIREYLNMLNKEKCKPRNYLFLFFIKI